MEPTFLGPKRKIREADWRATPKEVSRSQCESLWTLSCLMQPRDWTPFVCPGSKLPMLATQVTQLKTIDCSISPSPLFMNEQDH